jgi:hypothetical protein
VFPAAQHAVLTSGAIVLAHDADETVVHLEHVGRAKRDADLAPLAPGRIDDDVELLFGFGLRGH